MDLREIGWDGVDWIDRDQWEGSCEYGIEPSCSMKCWVVLEWPNEWLSSISKYKYTNLYTLHLTTAHTKSSQSAVPSCASCLKAPNSIFCLHHYWLSAISQLVLNCQLLALSGHRWLALIHESKLTTNGWLNCF
jgi:hypothetical protein